MFRLACKYLALTAVAASFTAVAQKPVITRNADEPGRSPYQQNVFFNQTPDNCPNKFYCVVNFNPVPAGYRLVITYASAYFFQASSSPAYAKLAIDGDIFGQQIILPTPSLSATALYATGGPVTFYVDAGHTPSILFSGYALQISNTAQASVVGYLVAVP